jgi:hypothetical protein
MLDEFTYLLADFTSCKFSFGEESIIQEKNSKAKERTTNVPCTIQYASPELKMYLDGKLIES